MNLQTLILHLIKNIMKHLQYTPKKGVYCKQFIKIKL